jgi:hypothetical protein
VLVNPDATCCEISDRSKLSTMLGQTGNRPQDTG